MSDTIPDRIAYPVVLSEDEDGEFLADFPDLQGAATGDRDRAETLVLAADCLAEALAARIHQRQDIPPPSPARGRPLISPGPLIAAKAALYREVRAAGITNVELARRLDCAEGEIRRLLNPRHNSKIESLDRALNVFGKRLSVEILPRRPAA